MARRFTANDLNLLTVLANVAAIRIEHERLRLIHVPTVRLARPKNGQARHVQGGAVSAGDQRVAVP